MRIYVLILSADPMRIYVYKEGLVRFATQSYEKIDMQTDRKTLKNVYVHLTNYALNKDNASYKQASSVDDDKGHKRTITSLMRMLKSEGKDVNLLQQQINDIIIKTLITIQSDLCHGYRTCQPSD